MINIKKIDLIVYDFDGVMTDNSLLMDQDGKEYVRVSRADGLAVSEIKKMFLKQIILSTEKNPIVKKRAEKLGIDCLQGINNKKKTLSTFAERQNINLEKTIYVGNDINDLEAMLLVGTKVCPSDSHHEILNISDFVLNKKGGQGVIREILDMLI